MVFTIRRKLSKSDVYKRKILKKYPKIFARKDLPLTQTCMCWGLAVRAGWLPLIDRLCRYIQEYVDRHTIPQVEATQVKEKFGGLCFYYVGGDKRIGDVIDFAEDLSNFICEHCGSMDEVTQTKGWIVTLCPKCKKQYEDKHKKRH